MRGTYHAATSRSHTQDEAPDEAADHEVQHEQRGTASQGAAARHDPHAHPMDAEGQAAEYPEPEKIQLSIPDAGGFENAVQQPGDSDGQNRLFEKFLDGLGSVVALAAPPFLPPLYREKLTAPRGF